MARLPGLWERVPFPGVLGREESNRARPAAGHVTSAPAGPFRWSRYALREERSLYSDRSHRSDFARRVSGTRRRTRRRWTGPSRIHAFR